MKNNNAPQFDAKFKTFALPAALKSQSQIIKSVNSIKEPVPPPKTHHKIQ